MSRWRKHVMMGLQDELESPKEGQAIVMALGTRGGNIVEVQYPNKRQTLVLLPSKFNKKLWVKRGGYLLIEEIPEQESGTGGNHPVAKITGTILAILYADQIKQLKKIPGAWPPEFADEDASGSGRQHNEDLANPPELVGDASSSSDTEGQLPTAASTARRTEQQLEQLTLGANNSTTPETGTSGNKQSTDPHSAEDGKGAGITAQSAGLGYEEEEDDDDPDDPMLQPNTNRRVIYHEVSDDDDESDSD